MARLTVPWREPVWITQQGSRGGINPRWLAFFQAIADQLAISPMSERSVSVDTQSASIAATAFPGVTIAPQMYRVNAALQITTAATSSSSLTLTVTWTSRGVACSHSFSALTSNDPALPESHVFDLYADGDTDIEYALAYASVGATAMVYAADLVLEPLPFNGVGE